MFDWTLFSTLVAACLPGVLVAVPGLLKTLEPAFAKAAAQGKTQPPKAVLLVATSAQTLLIVAGTAALGVALAPRVGLAAALLEALLSGRAAWAVVAPTLPAVLALELGGSLGIIALYYLVVRPRLDAVTLAISERLRTDTGILGHILYGGVVEEVIATLGPHDAAGLPGDAPGRQRHAYGDVGSHPPGRAAFRRAAPADLPRRRV